MKTFWDLDGDLKVSIQIPEVDQGEDLRSAYI